MQRRDGEVRAGSELERRASRVGQGWDGVDGKLSGLEATASETVRVGSTVYCSRKHSISSPKIHRDR